MNGLPFVFLDEQEVIYAAGEDWRNIIRTCENMEKMLDKPVDIMHSDL